MDVILMQEGDRPAGVSIHQRMREMTAEAVLADRVGFDIYGQGEQHFARFVAIVSTPEVNHAYLAALTERIRFRPMSSNLLPFNHPIRVVEQLERARRPVGRPRRARRRRSNNPYTMEGFGIQATDTKRYRDEALQVMGKALRRSRSPTTGSTTTFPSGASRPSRCSNPTHRSTCRRRASTPIATPAGSASA